jgi:hypothetical protein
MSIRTDRWYVRGMVVFAASVSLGLAMIVAMAALDGRTSQMLASDLPASLVMLAPFVMIGVVAGVASRRGTMVGLCAFLGGIAVVAALQILGYVGAQERLMNRAWTGAALTKGLFLCAAIPASLVGSFFGLMMGRSLVRSDTNRANNHSESTPARDQEGEQGRESFR